MVDSQEIEVTPEMVEAGVTVMLDSGLLHRQNEERSGVLQVVVEELLVAAFNQAYSGKAIDREEE